MCAQDGVVQRAVAVAVVGRRPDDDGALSVPLPDDGRFEVVAYCDEGLPGHETRRGPATHYTDYNVLLQESPAEVMFVTGPVEKRRDFAVRALNAGRHAVLDLPFCQDAAGAERVMKTALQRGLVATADLPWRRDPDLLAVRAALEAENLGAPWGVLCSVSRAAPEADAPAGPPLLDDIGLAMLDQVHLLLDQDVRSVTTHLNRPAPGADEAGFLVYLPLRKGGWAAAQAACGPTGLPHWTLYGAHATITAQGGRAIVTTDGATRSYEPTPRREAFWDNLHAVLREGAAPLYHPAGIVRAMKLMAAARESADRGDPVTI
ncbi:MAG: Gfo/Idh/MocA family oxidoreductase [Candidatus Brocadiaceae bacterium]|nr:Gfo/Idh/MocA family oxidoreductase [Candidatus Brocadiaceae bacterium]